MCRTVLTTSHVMLYSATHIFLLPLCRMLCVFPSATRTSVSAMSLVSLFQCAAQRRTLPEDPFSLACNPRFLITRWPCNLLPHLLTWNPMLDTLPRLMLPPLQPTPLLLMQPIRLMLPPLQPSRLWLTQLPFGREISSTPHADLATRIVTRSQRWTILRLSLSTSTLYLPAPTFASLTMKMTLPPTAPLMRSELCSTLAHFRRLSFCRTHCAAPPRL
jgi:hypothetical protein